MQRTEHSQIALFGSEMLPTKQGTLRSVETYYSTNFNCNKAVLVH